MTSLVETRIQAVDAATLAPIALRSLGCTDGKLVEWTCEPIRPVSGNWGPSVIYRFSGTVQQQGATIPWSLVLKVSSEAIQGVGDRRRADDARLEREASFYRSDLIHDFPAGFRPARCHALDEQMGELGRTEYWFWLEDLSPGSTRARWTIDDYYRAAHGLGLLSGTFVDYPALSHTAWLRRDNVRGYMERAAPQFHALFAGRTTPLIQRAFPAASVDSLRAMWQSRQEHLQTLDRLPQTLVHGDAQSTNLFQITNGAGDPEIAAIDWNAVGVGPIGLDAAQLFGPVLWTADADQFADAAQGVYAHYLAGVQASGWQGEPLVVRLGYTASMIRVRAFYVMRGLQVFMDETVQKRVAPQMQARGITLEDVADRVRHVEQYLRTLFEESLVLRDQLLSV